ncbi:MAG: phosphatase PAP2 family protein [Anaerolineales bacterium]|nr:phosphatase PAP2 family protein [Anaerolineales bacterium]MCB9127807.1 phosphatase PAP2 family protein [Ardenticatenales bacterium]
MDYGLFEAINGLAGRWTVADEFFRFFANDYIVPTAIVAMLVIDWFRGALRARRVVVHAILALLVANLIVKLSNLLWYRLRPFTLHDVTLLFYYPSDSSFPSNSAAAMWAMAWALWLRDRRSPLGRMALLLAALMGFSRIWVGVHYPADIVGGALVGIIAATLVERVRQRLRPLTYGLLWLAQRLRLA